MLQPSESTPDVVSPYRFQLHLFRSRLNVAAVYVKRHYPHHMWRLCLVEELYSELMQKFRLLSDQPIAVTADLSPEFVFRYSSVTAHTERDTLPCE